MNESHLASGNDRRASQRYQVELPVELEDGTGVTSSVSATGVVFETDRSFVVGAPIRFCLGLKPEGEIPPSRLYCEGSVVNVEKHGGRWTVIATISVSRFYT